MQQDTLDDTILLSLLAELNQTVVGVAAVLLADILHPAGLLGDVLLTLVLVEKVDRATCYSNHNDTDLYVLGHILNHCTAKIVDGSKTC